MRAVVRSATVEGLVSAANGVYVRSMDMGAVGGGKSTFGVGGGLGCALGFGGHGGCAEGWRV